MPVRVQGVLPYYQSRDVLRALVRVIRGDFGGNEKVFEFERRFAAFTGSKLACALPYARIGLYYLLRAMSLPKGCKALMTPITIPDMVNVIRSAGFEPRMVDMDPETLNFSPNALEEAITADTRVLLVTYLYGIVPANLDEIMEIAARRGLIVIEDISQALGAGLRGRKLGTLGSAGVCSLSSLKVCGTLYGGMVVSDDEELMRRVRDLSEKELREPSRRPFLSLISKILLHRAIMNDMVYNILTWRLSRFMTKRSPDFHHRFQTGDIGLILGLSHIPAYDSVPENLLYRYSGFQAEMGIKYLGMVDSINGELSKIAARLEAVPGIAARLPKKHPHGKHVYWRFPIRAEDRAEAGRRFADSGIETSVNALPVLSLLNGFNAFNAPAGAPLEGALDVHERYLLIPIHAWFTPEKIEAVVKAVSEYVNG